MDLAFMIDGNGAVLEEATKNSWMQLDRSE